MKLEQISVEYLDHMGSDLSVVNAARTSFGKESDWDTVDGQAVLKDSDAGLIKFLATGYRTKEWSQFLDDIIACDSREALSLMLKGYKNKAQHFAPFAHPNLQIRMTLPIFLARQFVKHSVGAVWSEESRRYMNDEPSMWLPNEWLSRPEDVKQGSGDPVKKQIVVGARANQRSREALETYKNMMSDGVAPEEARILLTQNAMTTVTWTGSLLFWSRVCNQRLDNHAQTAARELAGQISDIVRPFFPVSWPLLLGEV